MHLLLAILTAYAGAIAAYPVLRWRAPARSVGLAVLMTVVGASPLWVPATALPGRAVAALVAVAILPKLIDLHMHSSRRRRPGFRAFLAFLPNIHALVFRRID